MMSQRKRRSFAGNWLLCLFDLALFVCAVCVCMYARARTRLRQHPVLYLKDMYRTHIVSKIIFELFTINFNRQLLEESVGYQ